MRPQKRDGLYRSICVAHRACDINVDDLGGGWARVLSTVSPAGITWVIVWPETACVREYEGPWPWRPALRNDRRVYRIS